MLKDKKGNSINVYLWGSLAQENKELKKRDLVVLQGARVSQFGKKSLSCSSEHCKVFVNPAFGWAGALYEDFPEAKKPPRKEEAKRERENYSPKFGKPKISLQLTTIKQIQ